MKNITFVPEGIGLPHTIRHQLVRRDIMTRPDLTPSAQRVFAFFWQCTHQKKPMKSLFMREKVIAAETYLSVRSVRRALRVIEEAGLLVTYHRPRRGATSPDDLTTNRYVLHWHPYSVEAPIEATPVAADATEYPHGSPVNIAPERLDVPADVNFVTGGDRTGCPEGEAKSDSEAAANPTVPGSEPGPIKDLGFEKEFDQHDGTHLWQFSTADALLLFLESYLKPLGPSEK